MNARRAAFALGAFACIALPVPAPADDPPPLPSLRHLTFTVSVSLEQVVESPLDAVTTTVGEGREMRTTMAVGDTARSKSRRTATGTVVIDVVAATGDGGLVCDVEEQAADRRASRVRVGVASNGHLDYRPDASMNEEERTLLMLLGRGLIGPAPRDPGATWEVTDRSGDYASTTTFRVKSVNSSRETSLAYDGNTALHGPSAFSANVHGTVTYDPSRLVPLRGSEDRQIRESSGSDERTVRVGLDYALTSDSFDAR